ncbi:MAG: TetR/AcrR family transcriptional regulator [Pseudomonadota bacterium]
MTGAPRRDSAASRELILAAARQLLVQGDGVLEMAWVAKKAGVSQGLAYHRFGSKEGLLSAVVNDFYDKLEATVLMARFEEYDDWELREKQRTQRYIEFLFNDPLAAVITTRLAGSTVVVQVEAQRWKGLIEAGARNMAEGQARGVIKSQVDPKLLSAMALGAVRAAVTIEINDTQPKQPAELANNIWQFIRQGLGMEKAHDKESIRT